MPYVPSALLYVLIQIGFLMFVLLLWYFTGGGV
jgi:hypothetical protein